MIFNYVKINRFDKCFTFCRNYDLFDFLDNCDLQLKHS
jgi:hypothetical protein